jgi:hypothetical protein
VQRSGFAMRKKELPPKYKNLSAKNHQSKRKYIYFFLKIYIQHCPVRERNGIVPEQKTWQINK